MSNRSASLATNPTQRRPGFAVIFELPARRPCAFWLPAAFVLISGTILAVRNYVNHVTAHSAASSAAVATSMTDQNSDPETDAGSVSQRADSGLRRLCVSMAIVTIASVVAGFSIAHLLNHAPNGFRTVAEAESQLSIPVLGAVPVRD